MTQSVQTYARAALADRGYGPANVDFRESFPYTMDTFDRTVVALGFGFDDEGTQAEMGSDFKRRLYTVEMFVFGVTNTYGRNVANCLKFALDQQGTIPLLDISVDPPTVIDQLVVQAVSTERQVVPDPEPWQQFVYTTHVQVEDYYFASLV